MPAIANRGVQIDIESVFQHVEEDGEGWRTVRCELDIELGVIRSGTGPDGGAPSSRRKSSSCGSSSTPLHFK